MEVPSAAICCCRPVRARQGSRVVSPVEHQLDMPMNAFSWNIVAAFALLARRPRGFRYITGKLNYRQIHRQESFQRGLGCECRQDHWRAGGLGPVEVGRAARADGGQPEPVEDVGDTVRNQRGFQCRWKLGPMHRNVTICSSGRAVPSVRSDEDLASWARLPFPRQPKDAALRH